MNILKRTLTQTVRLHRFAMGKHTLYNNPRWLLNASKLQKVMEYFIVLYILCVCVWQKCIPLSIGIGLDPCNFSLLDLPILVLFAFLLICLSLCVSFFTSELANCQRLFRLKFIYQYTNTHCSELN